jgi:serine/threonine-protein kinase RsbT
MSDPTVDAVQIAVDDEANVSECVRQALRLATTLGFTKIAAHYIATAASELATNLYVHAGGGLLEVAATAPRPGLELTASDHGPGITDVERAMREGYSTAGGLGCGLPGVERLMDELQIQSTPGRGTVVRARKWL